MHRVVIIGHGPAGHRLAERLGTAEDTRVTVVGARPEGPYDPGLGLAALTTELPLDLLALPEHDQRVRTVAARAVSLDRAHRVVLTEDGGRHPYDTVVLATGAHREHPDVPGVYEVGGRPAAGVWHVDSPRDCVGVRTALTAGAAVAVFGADLPAVESAHALAVRGHHVTLVHQDARLMSGDLDPGASAAVARRLREVGVEQRGGAVPVELLSGQLVLREGEPVPAEALLLSTGTRPNTELALEAGLEVGETGVRVDGHLRSSDPRVHAIGSCAAASGTERCTLSAARRQAETLAEILTTSPERRYRHTEIVRARGDGLDLVALGPVELLAGNTAGVDHVAFSDPRRHRYARLALSGDRLLAANLVGLREAGAELSRVHEAGSPVPSNRFAPLFGIAAAGGAVSETVLCHCNNVSETALRTAFRQGARDVAALAAATRATTGCGSCADDVRRLCAALQRDRISEVTEDSDVPSEEDAA
ncbi:FAD-dependent oxidoreductase [Actinopolyspora mortivallis]|uniref:NAD(P)/FAD-dependent oxidoreductase n=1 Tax=Actinopolyspora mortivallis TaxID=33906 RepID=A0A2T0GXB7_ACTMO|nr:FAD-dependent oxidoreductase [Actinopolyspora mortivallis]PRW63737.1 NAD(P)/FAD-dependent oxidoreductase [Actinopolyspora mortivallis]